MAETDNGGATSMGVTKDTIKIVLLLGTKDQQQQTWTALGQSPPKDRSTDLNGYVEDAFADWNEVLAHSYNTWGRKFEYRDRQPDRRRRSVTARRRARRGGEEAVRGRRERAGDRRQRGGWRPGVRRRPRGQEDHRVRGRDHQRRGGKAGALPLARRHGLERGSGERGSVRGAAAQGRNGEVVG